MKKATRISRTATVSRQNDSHDFQAANGPAQATKPIRSLNKSVLAPEVFQFFLPLPAHEKAGGRRLPLVFTQVGPHVDKALVQKS